MVGWRVSGKAAPAKQGILRNKMQMGALSLNKKKKNKNTNNSNNANRASGDSALCLFLSPYCDPEFSVVVGNAI